MICGLLNLETEAKEKIKFNFVLKTHNIQSTKILNMVPSPNQHIITNICNHTKILSWDMLMAKQARILDCTVGQENKLVFLLC